MDYEWVNPWSIPVNMPSFVFTESVIIGVVMTTLFVIYKERQPPLDLIELQSIVTEQTGLMKRDLDFNDSSDAKAGTVNIKGITKKQFKWS